jgi:hypothetical protein
MQGKQLAPASGRSFEASRRRGARFVVAKRREGAIMAPNSSGIWEMSAQLTGST